MLSGFGANLSFEVDTSVGLDRKEEGEREGVVVVVEEKGIGFVEETLGESCLWGWRSVELEQDYV